MEAEHRHRLTLDSSPAAAGEASVWIRTLAEQHGVRQDWIDGLDLCVVELASNVVDYGYAGGSGEIFLEFRCSSVRVEFCIEDMGPPFNPLQQQPPAQRTTLEDGPNGGFGIHLVRQFADACEYQRLGDRNKLTVRFGAPLTHSRQAERRQTRAQDFPLQRSDSMEVAADQREQEDRRTLGFISRTELFQNVAYHELERIVASCKVVHCNAGELILAAGQHSQRVWLVIEGSLRVHFDGPHSDDFLDIPRGECVGEVSAADGKLSTAWVVAASPCTLLEIDEQTFVEQLLIIPNVGRNLIKVLAERMRRSNQRISERVRLETELKALQRELDFAHRIQTSMLPPNPLLGDEPRLDCYGLMRAARQVGGDFYDVIPLDTHRYLVAIGDVCNKGMPAALFMAQTLAMLRSMAIQEKRIEQVQLADIVSRGNDQLCKMNSEHLFVSIFLAIVDLEADQIRYVNAGHNPPMVRLPAEPLGLIESPRNPVAGMVPGILYRSGVQAFPKGSLLLMYTDGVTEAENARLDQFGEAALIDCFAQSHGSANAMVSSIVERVDAFAQSHPQADDITLLVLRRLH